MSTITTIIEAINLIIANQEKITSLVNQTVKLIDIVRSNVTDEQVEQLAAESKALNELVEEAIEKNKEWEDSQNKS